MQSTKSTHSEPTSAHPAEPPNADEHGGTPYLARVKAAGIDIDTMPEDDDEFRLQLARMIAMFINDWRGCPERLCQRNRGCMAPNQVCANAEPLPPDQQETAWRAVQPDIYKTIKTYLAEQGEEV